MAWRCSSTRLAAGATRVIPSMRGHPGWTDANRVEPDLHYGLLRDRVALMTIHLFGSCPMGCDSERCLQT